MDNTLVQFGLSVLAASVVGACVYFLLDRIEKRWTKEEHDRKLAEEDARIKAKRAENAVKRNKEKYTEIVQAKQLQSSTKYRSPDGVTYKEKKPKEKKFIANDFGELVVPERKERNAQPKKLTRAQRTKKKK